VYGCLNEYSRRFSSSLAVQGSINAKTRQSFLAIVPKNGLDVSPINLLCLIDAMPVISNCNSIRTSILCALLNRQSRTPGQLMYWTLSTLHLLSSGLNN